MRNRLLAIALPAALAACGPATPEPSTSDSPPPAVTAAPPPATTPAATPPPAPEPTAEEKKKAEAARQLAEDRAKMDADMKAESERWTPEIRAEAKKLAEAKPTSLKSALEAALKAKYRKPGNADRDKYRHPVETLTFFGLTPKMTVIEWGPGEGWYTELLAPTLATQGKLIVTTADPNGPPDQRSTFYGERLKRFLDHAPELYGKVDRIVVDSKAPKLGVEGKADMVLVIRAMHGMYRDKILDGFLGEVFKALKPGGVLGVVQHRANPDANPDEAAKKGYLPEPVVIKTVEAAGFKLSGKSEVNANPKDTKDYEEGVWALPPTLRMKDKDRQKYLDIGESDRMTLKFVKPKK
ncbi:MAG: class I SAM-dependent methyltransferase [Polyangiaceae bacterium]|nr:class I SAM-dependent methyltransferase [Polyangiaceae bacterium]